MQIHELNQRKNSKQLNEVDLAGPSGVWNVGKQILKNPAALASNTAMGSATQNAVQASAAASAAKLAKQGYKVGGAPVGQSNTVATQQLVKNLAGQWQQQAVAVAAKIKTAPVTEADVITNPELVKDPKERDLLNLFYKQQAQQTKSEPTDQIKTETNKKINAFSIEFQHWADAKLRTFGVDLNALLKNTQVSTAIQPLLTSIAIEGLADPKSVKSNELVEEFFTYVITSNQNLRQGSARAAAPAGGVSDTPQQNQTQVQQDQEVLKRYGVTLPQSQLDTLSQGLRRAADGGNVIRNTGNELLNAIARLAGFQVGRS